MSSTRPPSPYTIQRLGKQDRHRQPSPDALVFSSCLIHSIYSAAFLSFVAWFWGTGRESPSWHPELYNYLWCLFRLVPGTSILLSEIVIVFPKVTPLRVEWSRNRLRFQNPLHLVGLLSMDRSYWYKLRHWLSLGLCYMPTDVANNPRFAHFRKAYYLCDFHRYI